MKKPKGDVGYIFSFYVIFSFLCFRFLSRETESGKEEWEKGRVRNRSVCICMCLSFKILLGILKDIIRRVQYYIHQYYPWGEIKKTSSTEEVLCILFRMYCNLENFVTLRNCLLLIISYKCAMLRLYKVNYNSVPKILYITASINNYIFGNCV